MMTEDIFVDPPGDLGDDFSLGSSIDDINYIDAFSNHHNISDDICTNILSNEKTMAQSPLPETKPRGMAPCSDEESKIDEESMRYVIERYNRSSSPRKRGISFDTRSPPKISSGVAMNGKGSPNKHSGFFPPKVENIAIKARKTSAKTMMKHSKSDGLLTFALKAKYRKSSFQGSQNTSFSMNEMGGEDIPASGKANASWNNSPGSPPQPHDSLNGRSNRRYSLPSGKSSSMHDLLRQSKAKCKSQSLLRQSSAQSLSKRNSFQSINFVNDKLDVSSLMPAKQYSKSKSSSSGWFFPNVATPAMKARISKNPMLVDSRLLKSPNHSMGEMTDSLLHDACRLFPNSDTVVETALRMDPDAVRRSVIFTGDKDRDNHIYGYPINLALTHGAGEEMLQLLAQSGPDVLVLKDGSDCGASLGIALSSKTCTLATVELLLSANDKCAQIADRRGNYPLHVAVRYGFPVDLVMRLYAAYPKAQGMRNFHSQTPLDIAIQVSQCPEEVTDFLRSVSCQTSSPDHIIDNTEKVDANPSMGFLEEGLDDIMEINC